MSPESDAIALTSNIQGTDFVTDPETGFLVSSGGYALAGFNPQKKLRFIELAEEFWPNITAICAGVGIHRQTYSNHYKLDDKFRELVDAARERALDEAEAA